MNKLIIIFIGFIVILSSCDKKEIAVVKQSSQQVHKPVQSLTALIQKKVQVKYVYHGDVDRDPFIPISAEKLISSKIQSGAEAKMPNLGSLILKGVMEDKKVKIAILSSPTGSYILKNTTLYDSRNRIIPKIKGKITKKGVTLVTEDGFVREIKLKESELDKLAK